MFSKKATKIEEIFTIDLTLCSKCQYDGEDSFIFLAFLENTNFKEQLMLCVFLFKSTWDNLSKLVYFKLKLMGKSKMKIARNLDELHILTIIASNSKEIF